MTPSVPGKIEEEPQYHGMQTRFQGPANIQEEIVTQILDPNLMEILYLKVNNTF